MDTDHRFYLFEKLNTYILQNSSVSSKVVHCYHKMAIDNYLSIHIKIKNIHKRLDIQYLINKFKDIENGYVICDFL